MAGKSGYLRKAWDSAIDFILRKEVVGGDKLGNTYFRYFETNRGVKVERREVKWNTVHVMYDPNDIPSEWRMWLRKLRDNPPTPAELAQSEAKAQAMQVKVAILDEQDRLRRMRMQSMGAHAQQSSQQPDMSHVLQGMARAEGAATPAAGGGAAAPEQSQSQGTGDSFTPGVWKP